MKIDLKKFNKLVEDKYLTCQSHPTEPLLIWNYSHKAQFDRFWSPETTQARGLITDLEGNIVARPFVKFFNLLEHTGEDSKLPPLPLEEFEVYEKMDGSLIIATNYKDNVIIATRGSFESEQAIKAREILKKKYNVRFHPEYTHLLEVIYRENKIVVDYGDMEDLILLAVIKTETGEEVPLESVIAPFPKVKRYDGIKDLSKLQEMEEDNKEGFVVRFKSGVRVKCKFTEYVRLHRLVTGVNTKTIWEHLKDGVSLDEMIERVPDEFSQFVQKITNELNEKFNKIQEEANNVLKEIKNMSDRKTQAQYILKKYPQISSAVFSLLDGKKPDIIIWKMIKPEAIKPFKIESEVSN